MTKPTLSSFNTLAEIMIHTYERYLPTAFDESLSLLEKVNKVIQYLNQMGKINNDIILKWNETMEWVMGEGLNESVNSKLDELVADGTMDTIINQNVFADLNAKVDNGVAGLDRRIDRIWMDIKTEGAIGDGLADDTSVIQTALDFLESEGGGTLYIPAGDYKITQPLKWESHYITIIAQHGATIYPYNCDGLVFGDATGTERYNFTVIDGLTVDMTNALNYVGIRPKNADESTFKHVRVFKGKFGIYLDYSYNVTLDQCIAIMQNDTGLVANIADKLLVSRGQYGNGENGIQVLGGKGITFIGTSIERNNNVGMLIGTSSSRGGEEYADGVNVIGCYFERNAMIRGQGFVHVGWYESTVPEYAHGINFIGNYFNWDAGNPRNPKVPIYYLDKCTYVSFMSNRYINTGDLIAGASPHAYLNTISSMNDRVNYGREAVQSVKNQIILPFLISIPLDATGYGSYDYDLTGLLLTQKFVSGNILNPLNASNYHEIQYPNINSFKVIIRGGTPNGIADFTGFIMGTQDI